MQDMTDEEYDALDAELTRTVPKLGPNGSGFFTRLGVKGFQMIAVDETTAAIINARSRAMCQSLAEFIAALVQTQLLAARA